MKDKAMICLIVASTSCFAYFMLRYTEALGYTSLPHWLFMVDWILVSVAVLILAGGIYKAKTQKSMYIVVLLSTLSVILGAYLLPGFRQIIMSAERNFQKKQSEYQRQIETVYDQDVFSSGPSDKSN